jgi:hypothetical protein
MSNPATMKAKKQKQGSPRGKPQPEKVQAVEEKVYQKVHVFTLPSVSHPWEATLYIEKKYGSLIGGGKFFHYKNGQRREGTFSHQPANGSNQSGKLFDAGTAEFLLAGFDLTTAKGQGWIDPAGNGHKYDIGWSLGGEINVKQKK